MLRKDSGYQMPVKATAKFVGADLCVHPNNSNVITCKDVARIFMPFRVTNIIRRGTVHRAPTTDFVMIWNV